MSAYAINLLPKKQKKAADKLLYFVLHYFRYIIVITQIVVISVFFYRFREDQQIIDLKESFKQKQQILLITLPIIEEAEAIEQKAEKVEVLLSQQENLVKHMDYIIDVIPQDVSLTTIEINDGGMQVIGNSGSIISIRSLHKKIKQKEEYAQAHIVAIQENEDGSYGFGISVPFIPLPQPNAAEPVQQ